VNEANEISHLESHFVCAKRDIYIIMKVCQIAKTSEVEILTEVTAWFQHHVIAKQLSLPLCVTPMHCIMKLLIR